MHSATRSAPGYTVRYRYTGPGIRLKHTYSPRHDPQRSDIASPSPATPDGDVTEETVRIWICDEIIGVIVNPTFNHGIQEVRCE